MQRVDVKSSNIQSIGYDDGLLEIEFTNGRIYQYDGVELEKAEALINAESVGKFFFANIKNKYQFFEINTDDNLDIDALTTFVPG